MLGFMAQASSTEIHLHDAELEDARWFTREEIVAGKVVPSSAQSIAFRLIEHWYDANAPRTLREQLGMRVGGAKPV
jgi:NAD+ diphosphatase